MAEPTREAVVPGQRQGTGLLPQTAVRRESAAEFDPRWLRAFLAVAEEGHFGRAAARLSMGQPSLSRHIQQLERALGVRLFHRASHGVTLTEAGRLVRPEAENTLAQNARLLRTAQLYAGSARSEMTVGAPLPGPAGGLLAEAARRFRKDRNNAQVAVTDLSDNEQSGALAQHRIDAALTWGRPRLAGLTDEVLLREPLAVLLTVEHPLAACSHLPLSALPDEPLLFPVRERQHCWTLLRDAAAAQGIALEPVPTAPAAVLDFVAHGLGYSVVPASLSLRAPCGLAFVPLPVLSVQMSVMWRHTEQSLEVPAFVAACRAAAASLIGTRPDIWSAPSEAGA
jgi:DNA-binding transcriptional LysR family regulator